MNEVEAYVRDAATARGIPDWLAAAIADAESGLRADNPGDYYVDWLHYPAGTPIIARRPNGAIVPKGTPGAVATSFGPFQLRAGQAVTGDANEAGLGDAAIAAGINVLDPTTWRQQIDFALNHAASLGTFAGVWSTAVGELAARFTGAHPVPVGQTTGEAPAMPSPANPSNVDAGGTSGITTPGGTGGSFPFTIPTVTVPGVGWVSGLELPQGLTVLAQTIAQLPGVVAAPFVGALNQLGSLLAFVGQVHIYERIGLVLLGVILVVIGVVLFALSFVDRSTVRTVAAAAGG